MKSPPNKYDLHPVHKKAHSIGSIVHRDEKQRPFFSIFPQGGEEQLSLGVLLFHGGEKRVHLFIILLSLFSTLTVRGSRCILQCRIYVVSVSVGFVDKNGLATKREFFHTSSFFNGSPILFDNEKTCTIEQIDQRAGRIGSLARYFGMFAMICFTLAATLGLTLLDNGLYGMAYWYLEQPASFYGFTTACQKMLEKELILDEKGKTLCLPTVLTCKVLNVVSFEYYAPCPAGQVSKFKQLRQNHKIGSRILEKYEGKSAAAVKGREPEKGRTITNDHEDLNQEEQDTKKYTAADIDMTSDKTKDKKDGGDSARYRHSRSTEDHQDGVIQCDLKRQANKLVGSRPSQPQIDDLVHISKKITVDNSIRKIVDDGILKYKSAFLRTSSLNSTAERHMFEQTKTRFAWLWTSWVPRDQPPPPRWPQIEPIPIANPTGARLRRLMRHSNFRIASMVHLARDIKVLDMSEAGLYLDEGADEFRCHRCGLAVPRPRWPQKERPADVHRRLSPDCPVVNPAASVDRRSADATNGGQEERREVASRRDRDVDRRDDSSPSERVGERKESGAESETELQRRDSEPQTEREVQVRGTISERERNVQGSDAESPSERDVQTTDTDSEKEKEEQSRVTESKMDREAQMTAAESQVERGTQGTDTDAQNKTETKGRHNASAEGRDANSREHTYRTEEEQNTGCNPVKQQDEEVFTPTKDGEQRVTLPTSLEDEEETQHDTFAKVGERDCVVVQKEGRHPVTMTVARDDKRDAASSSVKDTESQPDASFFKREAEGEYSPAKAGAKQTDSDSTKHRKRARVEEQSTDPTYAKGGEKSEVSASAKEEKEGGCTAAKTGEERTNPASVSNCKEDETVFVEEQEEETRKAKEDAEKGEKEQQQLQEEKSRPSSVGDCEVGLRDYHSTTRAERNSEGRLFHRGSSQNERTGAFCDNTTHEDRGMGLDRNLWPGDKPIIGDKFEQPDNLSNNAGLVSEQNLASEVQADCDEVQADCDEVQPEHDKTDSTHLVIINISSDIRP